MVAGSTDRQAGLAHKGDPSVGTKPLQGDAMTLIERLEAATDGSRDLDKQIWLHIGENPMRLMLCPGYTTSLDAALTLVPDGFDYIVYRVDGECCAEVGPPGSFGFTKCVGTPTAVLALCIAALKARTP